MASTKKTKKKQPQLEEINIKPGEIIIITKDMLIGDVIAVYPQTLKIFESYGIHCPSCFFSQYESIQEGAELHKLNADEICKKLNNILRKNNKKKL